MLLTASAVLCACIALTSAFPWSLVGETAENQAMVAQVASSSCLGLPSPVPGSSDNLHICSFFGQDDVCAVPTTLTPCCSSMAVTGQMARALTFDRFNDSQPGQIARSVRFYQVNVGACYFIEPRISTCMNCPVPSCATVPNPFCEDGVDAPTCSDGACQCKRGFGGEDCCLCMDGFFRPIGRGNICEECDCCSANIVGESSSCSQAGECGECKPGFFGTDCCQECDCCAEGTLGGSDDECSADDGQCPCAPGYSGRGCCTNDCGCCTNGTVDGSNECDASGQCTCTEDHTGTKCCQALLCPPLANPADGTVSMTGLSIGSTATYTCNEGFQLTSETPRQCVVQSSSSSAGWTDTAPTCTSLITCGERTDMYFILDTSRDIDNHILCLQHYTVMDIVASLRIGTQPQSSSVEAILYPAPRIAGEDVPADLVFRLDQLATCPATVNRIEDLQEDIFTRIFDRTQPEFETRGESTSSQRAIQLLGGDLPDVLTASRRRIGILITSGDQTPLANISVSEARAFLPSGFELLAVGYNTTNRPAMRLEQDLLEIAGGNQSNVIMGASIIDVARALVERLQRDDVICDSAAEAILGRINTGNYGSAQRYCSCLQNRFSGAPICTNPPAPPVPTCSSSSSATASLMNDFSEFFEFANQEDELDEDVKSEIMEAVREVLNHHG